MQLTWTLIWKNPPATRQSRNRVGVRKPKKTARLDDGDLHQSASSIRGTGTHSPAPVKRCHPGPPCSLWAGSQFARTQAGHPESLFHPHWWRGGSIDGTHLGGRSIRSL